MVIKNPIKQGYQISFNCDQELSLTKTIKCHKIVIKDQIWQRKWEYHKIQVQQDWEYCTKTKEN